MALTTTAARHRPAASDAPALPLAAVRSGGQTGADRAALDWALAHGVPIVTNELGSRGCQAPGPACSIGESNAELAGAAARHLASAEYAEGAGKVARKWAIENYAADAVAQLQLDRIEALLPRSPAGG